MSDAAGAVATVKGAGRVMANDHVGTVELRLPSQLRFLGVVDAVVQSFSSEFGLAADDINNLSTAAIEAAMQSFDRHLYY